MKLNIMHITCNIMISVYVEVIFQLVMLNQKGSLTLTNIKLYIIFFWQALQRVLYIHLYICNKGNFDQI